MFIGRTVKWSTTKHFAWQRRIVIRTTGNASNKAAVATILLVAAAGTAKATGVPPSQTEVDAAKKTDLSGVPEVQIPQADGRRVRIQHLGPSLEQQGQLLLIGQEGKGGDDMLKAVVFKCARPMHFFLGDVPCSAVKCACTQV